MTGHLHGHKTKYPSATPLESNLLFLFSFFPSGGEGLKSTSISELMTTLDSYEEELGRTHYRRFSNLSSARMLTIVMRATVV